MISAAGLMSKVVQVGRIEGFVVNWGRLQQASNMLFGLLGKLEEGRHEYRIRRWHH